jgi:hypothetical protein
MNILNKQSRTADKGWYSSSPLGVGLTGHHRKSPVRSKILHRALTCGKK